MLELDQNQLYKEVLMEHYKRPRNTDFLENVKTFDSINASCGDSVKLQVKVQNGIIKHVKQQCQGCSISCASSSVMSEILTGKTVNEALNIINDYNDLIKGQLKHSSSNILLESDASAFSGVKNYPARHKCALISWDLLKNILSNNGDNFGTK